MDSGKGGGGGHSGGPYGGGYGSGGTSAGYGIERFEDYLKRVTAYIRRY